VSNVTGQLAGDEIATAGYWRRHVREAVRFSDGVATLHREKIRTMVEVGPSPTLTRMAQRCPQADQATWLTSLRKDGKDAEAMLATLAALYVAGQPIDWRALTGEEAWPVVLPTYAFQRETYWHDLSRRRSNRFTAGIASGHPLLGERLASPMHVYQTAISLAAMPWLGDHRILGYALFPGTGFLELALAAARRALETDDVVIENLSFENRLDLSEDGEVTVQVIVSADASGAHRVNIYSAEENQAEGEEPRWRLHASASASAAPAATPAPVVLEQGDEVDLEAHYLDLARVNAVYGPAFRGLKQMWRSGQTIVGRLELPGVPGLRGDDVLLHPALLDACLHTAGVGLPWDNGAVPVGVDRYRVYRPGATAMWSRVTIPPTSSDATGIRVDMTIADASGEVIAEIEGLEFHRAPKTSFQAGAAAGTPAWLLEVEWPAAPIATSVTPGSARWLLFGDETSLTRGVAAELRGRGDSVDVVTPGQTFQQHAGGWQLDARNQDDYRRLLSGAASADGRPRWTGVIWMSGVASVPPADDFDAIQASHRERTTTLLAAIPVIGDSGASFWLVTRGSQPVAGSVPNTADAPLWGVGNVIGSEYPALRAVRIDLDPVERDDEAVTLAAAIAAADGNERVALRNGQRYVARLTQGVLVSPESTPRRLEIDDRGVLENLRWREVPRTPPGPREVEIRVLATGLNFRDVLNALGMYPGDPGPLGNECAGIVTAVGEGVADLAVGDEVVAMIDQSFATFVIAPANMTVLKPSNLTFAEAATIPVTFLTAEYGLSSLGRMGKGDRVLVHAATGGVGMAAMQLALRAGAEIFATAGSPAKRALARALGAHHVSDSRSLSFADDFARATNGEGVDIVINSLAGDFIPTTLGLLRPGGRFIEIGKTGIWDEAAVKAKYPGVEYYPLYLGEVTAADPLRMRNLLMRLMDDFATGVLTPLPQTIYPIERAEEAFRYMGQGKHTGKIVLTQRHAPAIRADRSYLVTGGLGGLGLISARGLIERGARHIVLTSRRPASAAAQQAIDEMQASGASVVIALGDIGVEADVLAIVSQIRETMPPLGGILHAAGFVDDGVLPEQSWSRFERVMAPKVAGTWFLHRHTRDLPLDFFVCFSSGAALLGSPGQSNYAAANAFMDALAHVREAEGRPALSINWGTWADVGMAAELGEQHHRRWAQQGIRTIRPREGVQMMFDAMAASRSATVAAVPLDRTRLGPELGSFFERLTSKAAKLPKAAEMVATDLPREVGAAAPGERARLVAAFLSDQLIKVLAVDPSTRFRSDQSIIELGLDSLMAMELRNRVQHAAKVRLSVADLMAGSTIDDLVPRILEGMNFAVESETPVAAGDHWEEGSL
jgi:NADPH:quinone reductase-like Zn-dependent oxidoreductase/aryl carrier-like protein